jgi:hypothetical protein
VDQKNSEEKASNKIESAEAEKNLEDVLSRTTGDEYNDYYIYSKLLAENIKLYNSTKMCGCCNDEVNLAANTPIDERNIVEVVCKGLIGHAYCIVPESVTDTLNPDDLVLISSDEVIDIARMVQVGEIVALKRQRLGLYGETLPQMVRKAAYDDISKYKKNCEDEIQARETFKLKAKKHNLTMKLVDVHYQYDKNKIYFFYTSEGRVDFRDLAKDLAAEFKTRIELRQIGVRDEAKKIGGLGTCGREFCCSAFLCNFKRITSQLAMDQNVASNISKLSGPCGKLKCCLSYEM